MAITVVGLIRNTLAVSRMPLLLMALAADLKDAAAILVLEKEDAPCAPLILALLALGSVGLFARLDDFGALTSGTLYRNGNHRLPPRAEGV
jgi:hypothetical protein